MAATSAVILALIMFLNTMDKSRIYDDSKGLMRNSLTKKVECATNITYPPPENRTVPEFIINLDLQPQERWKNLTEAYKFEMNNFLTIIKNETRPIFHGLLFDFIDYELPKLVNTLPYPFADEMRGISAASGLKLGEVALYNIFYEVFTVCTSILAQTPDGHLYHGRNMDFGVLLGWDPKTKTWLGTEVLRKLTVQLDFQRGGTTVFKATSFVGYVGITTAMKPQSFSVTVDERFNIFGGYIGILEWILGRRSGHWMGFLTREVMENATTYAEAQHILSSTELLSPVYFILGGNASGQASIITRGLRFSDIWEIGTKNSSWYLVETNYDHWKRPPPYDDRRGPAIQCMNEMGQQNLSFGGLFNVFSTRPVMNKLTVYTTLMEVASGTYNSFIQHCPNPCLHL